MPLKIVFAGTPDFAATILEALLTQVPASNPIIACYTQPDRPAGRGRKLSASPVKVLAESHQIPVFQPLNFRDPAAIDALAELQPDLMIVVAYGLILPQRVLDIPRYGCINVHASLLPRWRGAAPIQRALMAGDAETGVTLMQMEAGLDTGPMLSKVHTPILDTDTSASLHDRLATLGAQAMVDLLKNFPESGIFAATRQNDHEACYAQKLHKDESLLDWTQPASALCQQIRGLNPWPVAGSQLGGETVRIWNATAKPETSRAPQAPGTILQADASGIEVSTGEGSLVLTELQLPGGKALSAAQLLNSRSALFAPGQCFESRKAALPQSTTPTKN
ncbi:Methionyl-tRNA formyltransferase [gamma proteobacterium HdN1]|nr:Methionyl-tRNA formyltransferase [gamma proteobacterium HdN1]